MKKISFTEYYKSKELLKNAANNSPKYFRIYEILKYCKIPLTEQFDEYEKDYISLKPKDIITILWEELSDKSLIPKYVIINDDSDKRYKFSWNHLKLNKWIKNTTIPKNY